MAVEGNSTNANHTHTTKGEQRENSKDSGNSEKKIRGFRENYLKTPK